MKMRSRQRVVIGTCTAALMMSGTAAFAQAAGAPSGASAGPATAADDGTQIQEIVVTAQRREERLQNVPVAVSAISAGDAINKGITTTSDLTAAIPALNFTQQANGATAFIRGVGSTFTLAGAEPSVAIYVDGVYLPSSQASIFSLNNIQRIEVLRGPQGTLFGRNATGGVIQVVTKDPSQKASVDVSGGYANYDTFTGNLYATAGLTSNLAADVAVYWNHQGNGWGHNLLTGDQIYKGKDLAARSKIMWTPTDTTTVRLSVDYGKSVSTFGFGLKPVPGRTAIGGFGFPGFYDVNENFKDLSTTTRYATALQITQDVKFATLTSTTAYQSVKPRYTVDEDGSPVPLVDGAIAEPDKAFTQEFQLASQAGSKISWIGGLFYFHDDAGSDPLNIVGLATGGVRLLTNSNQKTDSFAGYAQATAEIVDKTHLTVGLRFTHDDRRITGNTTANGALIETVEQHKSFEKLTWRLSLDHQFTPDILGYVSYNRGFKSGFFNTTVLSDPVIRPEVIDSYEAGLKTEFFDHALRLNVAGYYYDYKNLQVNNTIAGATRILNAASAEIYGVEGDVVVVPVRHLTLTAGMSLIHGRYKDFPDAPSYPANPAGGNFSTTIDASGLDTQQTPRAQFNAGIDYTLPTEHGDFGASVLYAYTNGFYWDPADELKQPKHSLVNASLSWASPSKAIGVRVWTKNLTNSRYYLYASNTPLLTAFSPAPPRTYGVTVSSHF